MAKAPIKTSILIISDTHCAPLTEADAARHGGASPRPPFEAPLPSADLLIHCGDLTMAGSTAQYHDALDMLQRIDAPVKLVIAGNHDLTLDREFVASHSRGSGGGSHGHSHFDRRIPSATNQGADATWAAARALWTSPDHRARREGVAFLDEGVHDVALANGARVRVYASPYTPEFCDWGFPYGRDEDRFNPVVGSGGASFSGAQGISVPSFSSETETSADASASAPIDIMITHGPPWGRLDAVPQRNGTLLNTGCSHLLRALMRARPLIHCFGHIHEGHGAERVEWSDSADAVANSGFKRDLWERRSNPAWEAGIILGRDGIARIEPDLEAAKADRAIAIDVSSESDSPLQRGRDTLLVNASIMTVTYKPDNAPWLVEVDLPAA